MARKLNQSLETALKILILQNTIDYSNSIANYFKLYITKQVCLIKFPEEFHLSVQQIPEGTPLPASAEIRRPGVDDFKLVGDIYNNDLDGDETGTTDPLVELFFPDDHL